MTALFLRILEDASKARALRGAIEADTDPRRFRRDPPSFSVVPRSPFAYWTPDGLLAAFRELPRFERPGRSARVGLQTSDDERFVRAWWALAPEQIRVRWFPLTKGGGASPFYADLEFCLNWSEDGSEIKAFAETTPGTTHWSRKICNTEWYFQPGFSWATRTARLAPSCVPAGCIFSVSRYQAFVQSSEALLATVAVLNSQLASALMAMSSDWFSRPKFIIGNLQLLPVPDLTAEDQAALARIARTGWSLRRSLDTRVETSHAFALPGLLQVGGGPVGERAGAWAARVAEVETELAEVQVEIDERCFELYGIDEADRESITAGFTSTDEDGSAGSDEKEEAAEDEGSVDAAGLAAELVSWTVGVAFGRFDLRLATGERELPGEPGPFDPLPACSPGMLTGDDGLPLADPPPGYPLSFPASGVLVDDPGHPADLAAAIRAVFEVVFGNEADARWQEAAALLDPKKHDPRGWLAKRFFDHHLKTHSKSRRKAPIFWQLATPSASYSVWLYAHRLTKDSLYQLLNDYIAPKLADEERKHTTLIQTAGPTPTASQRKELAAQEAFVEELRELKETLTQVAPVWNPDLNDGVTITACPLRELVPHHKPWQKELNTTWQALIDGKYDWARLAFHLWPERVIPEAHQVRSLAIAHNLETTLWQQDQHDNWQPKPNPDVQQLIQQHRK